MRPTLVLAAALLVTAGPLAQARPDFSGTWTYDAERSMEAQHAAGKIVVAKMLGDRVMVAQDAATLKFSITFMGAQVLAEYKLDGSASTNISSDGGKDVPVISHVSWEGDKLIIMSTSTSDVKGAQVTIETKRVIWIDDKGGLIVDRSGTPLTEVTPSRSVYKKVVR